MSGSARPPDRRARSAAAQRQEQQRSRRRRLWIILVGVIALAVIVVVALYLASRNAEDQTSGGRPGVSTERGGIVVDAEGVVTPPDHFDDGELGWLRAAYGGDAVVVSIYSDFLCPYCAWFEALNGATLDRLREAGEIVVVYHRVAILDRYSSGTQFSTRAAAASFEVAQNAPAQYLAFNEALLAAQPDEGGSGLTDQEIAGLAAAVGVPDVTSIAARATPLEWVAVATERASQDLRGGLATPTILLNGQELDVTAYDWRQEGELVRAIDDARSGS